MSDNYWTDIPDWIIEYKDKRLTPSVKWLYVCLVRFCAESKNGEFTASDAEIARMSGLVRWADARVGVNRLKHCGLIEAKTEKDRFPFSGDDLWHIKITGHDGSEVVA